MRIDQCVSCTAFPCRDVRNECYSIPSVHVKPDAVSVVVISECAPDNPEDNYYAAGDPLFQRTTVQAFRDAGVDVSSVKDILHRGVYLTTAIKCGKTAYAIRPETIRECSILLERELALFPNLKALLLMGDVAIKAMNYIAANCGEKRAIPSGSTYKLRAREHYFRGMRLFPSYLQAGPSFFIEKSKRRMIAEDIAAALAMPG